MAALHPKEWRSVATLTVSYAMSLDSGVQIAPFPSEFPRSWIANHLGAPAHPASWLYPQSSSIYPKTKHPQLICYHFLS